jgi:uncharacterized glyoxalase superfamily protein PhnB
MADLAISAWRVIPQFDSKSIDDTVKFYTDELHFKLGGTYSHDNSDTLTFCSLYMGKHAAANIYFFTKPEAEFKPSSAMIAMGAAELEQYYALIQANASIEITEPLEDKPWRYRQFSIKDIDGNALSFFRFLDGPREGANFGS